MHKQLIERAKEHGARVLNENIEDEIRAFLPSTLSNLDRVMAAQYLARVYSPSLAMSHEETTITVEEGKVEEGILIVFQPC